MSEILMPHSAAIVPLTADIVSAYVANNHVAESSLPGLIAAIHGSLMQAVSPDPATSDEPVVEKATPAQVKRSITPDALISFIDGKGYKTLKRHLTLHGHTPTSYRACYGLPDDYPMVTAAYSAHRSELARSMGLGRGRAASVQAADSNKADRRPTTQAAA